jgi:undecaprenyl-diphosphatase
VNTAFVEAVLVAALRGASEVLPISSLGQMEALRIVFGGPLSASGAVHFAVVGALAIALRRRLRVVLGGGLRAIARPTLIRTSPGAYGAAIIVLASLASGIVRVALGARAGSPTTVGLGLFLTGIALASTSLTKRGTLDGPAHGGAIVVGLAHGLGVLPGGSSVAGALVVLLWLGVRGARAVELALILTMVPLIAAIIRSPLGASDSPVSLELLASTLAAFAGALVAVAALRALAARSRVAWLAAWLLPMGAATLFYGRALIHTATCPTTTDRLTTTEEQV